VACEEPIVVRTLCVALAVLLALACMARGQSEPFTYGEWRSCKMGGGGYLQAIVACPSDPQRYYAYVDVGGIYRSDDRGRRWRMLHGNWRTFSGGYAVRGVVVDPRNADRIIAAIGDAWGDSPGIMTSVDGGQTWQRRLEVQFLGNSDWRWAGDVLVRHPQSPDTVFAAPIDRGLWRSDDNGVTWQQVGRGAIEHLFPADLRIDSRDPNRMWLCAKEATTSYGGKQAKFAEGLFQSDDGGTTWKKLAASAPSEVLQDLADPGRLYGLFGDEQIKMSIDGGASWTPFSQGLPPPTPGDKGYTSDSRFDAIAAGPGFVITASTKGTFYRRDAGAAQWTKLEPTKVEEIFEGEPWYHVNGRGWALAHITIDPRDPKHWFFTDWFAIYQTTDAGQTWQLSMDGVEVTVLHTL
jgi:photosystem II stability/assembly factor-like uncharacterized protein